MTLWTLEFYEDGRGRRPAQEWLDDLSDFKFVAVDAALRLVLSERGLELASTEWLKPLGKGLHEFRIRHTEAEVTAMFGDDASASVGGAEKILIRIFVHFHGEKVILLLGGYDKAGDLKPKKQQSEIELARKRLSAWQREQPRPARRHRRSM